MENLVKINRVYRHFKGNYYYVSDIVINGESDEKMVLYRPLYGEHSQFVRSMDSFCSDISSREDNVTGQKLRFELIEL